MKQPLAAFDPAPPPESAPSVEHPPTPLLAQHVGRRRRRLRQRELLFVLSLATFELGVLAVAVAAR